ncbi:MAG: hypothetical protein WA113_00215 [Desulfitobacteriaceae bacterium]
MEPNLLNDDRFGRAMTELGGDKKAMEEVLYNLVMDSSKKAGIPLFRHDTFAIIRRL